MWTAAEAGGRTGAPLRHVLLLYFDLTHFDLTHSAYVRSGRVRFGLTRCGRAGFDLTGGSRLRGASRG